MLSSLFQRFGRRASFETPSPTSPICVIGDVHGCIAHLEKLLPQVPQDHRIVLDGDYIDRGENSAEVLRLISDRADFTCLKGNHEDMLLSFIHDPVQNGFRWLRYGGLQTLASFGVGGARTEMSEAELIDCRDSMVESMGGSLIQWLDELPTYDYSGNVLVTHAGADPGAPVDQQSDKTLMWGHPDFQTTDRQDGVWVVYGHTIVELATARQGRISIDTGAYATGVLSAVCLSGGEPEFITVGP